MNKKETKSH